MPNHRVTPNGHLCRELRKGRKLKQDHLINGPARTEGKRLRREYLLKVRNPPLTADVVEQLDKDWKGLSKTTVNKIESSKEVDIEFLCRYLENAGEVDDNGKVTEEIVGKYIDTASLLERAAELSSLLGGFVFANDFRLAVGALTTAATWLKTLPAAWADNVHVSELLGKVLATSVKSALYDIEWFAKKKVVLRAEALGKDQFREAWRELLKLVEHSSDKPLRLVSFGDLEFWKKARNQPNSPEAEHVKPLTDFPTGRKQRVLIVNKGNHHANWNEVVDAVRWMEETGFHIHITPFSSIDGNELKASIEKVYDFGIMGDVAYGYFDNTSSDLDRDLVEWFCQDKVQEATKVWDVLTRPGVCVWHSKSETNLEKLPELNLV